MWSRESFLTVVSELIVGLNGVSLLLTDIGAVDVWVPWKIDLPGVDRRRRRSSGRTPPELLG
jgi:hypothetical protein